MLRNLCKETRKAIVGRMRNASIQDSCHS